MCGGGKLGLDFLAGGRVRRLRDKGGRGKRMEGVGEGLRMWIIFCPSYWFFSWDMSSLDLFTYLLYDTLLTISHRKISDYFSKIVEASETAFFRLQISKKKNFTPGALPKICSPGQEIAFSGPRYFFQTLGLGFFAHRSSRILNQH